MADEYKSINCYKILGIPWESSPQEIHKAFRIKSKESHPDLGGSHEQQIKVNLAYEILSDPVTREQHDRYWKFLREPSAETKSTPKPSYESNTKKSEHDKYRKSYNQSTIQQLFIRVTNIIDQELNKLRAEGEKWVNSKVSSYEDKVNKWRYEQVTLFKQKLASYETKLSNLRQKQTKIFNQKIAGYDKLHFSNVRNQKKLLYAAIAFSGFALLSITIPLGFMLLSLDDPIKFFGIAISLEIWIVAAFFWLWYENSKWIKINSQKIPVKDPEWKHKIIVILAHKQNSQRMKVSTQEVTINAPDSLNRIKNILQAELFSKNIVIGPYTISYDSNDWRQRIANLAHEEWHRIFDKDEIRLNAKREKYLRNVADICDLVDRNITLDSSEEQVARRIAVTFFMMGYIPISYLNQPRMFVFSDGDENIILRFRHRTGSPTNISFVKRMVSAMLASRANKGFLFCTPGLSGNAAEYANANSIKWYSLETMNKWIDSVLSSGYQGPTGDIFQHIDHMVNFLRKIAISLPNR